MHVYQHLLMQHIVEMHHYVDTCIDALLFIKIELPFISFKSINDHYMASS